MSVCYELELTFRIFKLLSLHGHAIYNVLASLAGIFRILSVFTLETGSLQFFDEGFQGARLRRWVKISKEVRICRLARLLRNGGNFAGRLLGATHAVAVWVERVLLGRFGLQRNMLSLECRCISVGFKIRRLLQHLHQVIADGLNHFARALDEERWRGKVDCLVFFGELDQTLDDQTFELAAEFVCGIPQQAGPNVFFLGEQIILFLLALALLQNCLQQRTLRIAIQNGLNRVRR
jgi:hypothetical protein